MNTRTESTYINPVVKVKHVDIRIFLLENFYFRQEVIDSLNDIIKNNTYISSYKFENDNILQLIIKKFYIDKVDDVTKNLTFEHIINSILIKLFETKKELLGEYYDIIMSNPQPLYTILRIKSNIINVKL